MRAVISVVCASKLTYTPSGFTASSRFQARPLRTHRPVDDVAGNNETWAHAIPEFRNLDNVVDVVDAFVDDVGTGGRVADRLGAPVHQQLLLEEHLEVAIDIDGLREETLLVMGKKRVTSVEIDEAVEVLDLEVGSTDNEWWFV